MIALIPLIGAFLFGQQQSMIEWLFYSVCNLALYYAVSRVVIMNLRKDLTRLRCYAIALWTGARGPPDALVVLSSKQKVLCADELPPPSSGLGAAGGVQPPNGRNVY